MPRTRPPYDEEFRREAVGLLARGERSLAALSNELGVSQQTLRSWRKQAGVEAVAQCERRQATEFGGLGVHCHGCACLEWSSAFMNAPSGQPAPLK